MGDDMQEEYTNGYDHDNAAIASQLAAQNRPLLAPPIDYSRMISILAAWRDILNSRLLALLALAGAMIGFGFVMYDPQTLRLWGLGIYSVLCLWPVMALYHRKG